MKALIVEDDTVFANTLRNTLQQNGIYCDICSYGEDGLERLDIVYYDILITDINLPDISGHDIIKSIRIKDQKKQHNIPIIVISGMDDSVGKVQAFMQGADDYISKPCHIQELIMRIYSVIRRCKGYAQNIIKIRNLSLNLHAKSVAIFSENVHLSSKEYELLELLALNQGSTICKNTIMDALYSGSLKAAPTSKIVDVLVCKIRKKLIEAYQSYIRKEEQKLNYHPLGTIEDTPLQGAPEPNASAPIVLLSNNEDHGYIKTIWGIGYRID